MYYDQGQNLALTKESKIIWPWEKLIIGSPPSLSSMSSLRYLKASFLLVLMIFEDMSLYWIATGVRDKGVLVLGSR